MTLRHQRDEFSEQPGVVEHDQPPNARHNNADRSRDGSGEAGFVSA